MRGYHRALSSYLDALTPSERASRVSEFESVYGSDRSGRARVSECSFRSRRPQNGFDDLSILDRSIESIYPHYFRLKVVSGIRGQSDIET